MKIAVASDEQTSLTRSVCELLKQQGHKLCLMGALTTGEDCPWPLAAHQLAEAVAKETVDEGILFCWTGTGASIAANKVPGIRAALVGDAETARGARWWNDANVLVLSSRATSEAIAAEILAAWFQETFKPEEADCIALLTTLEQQYAHTISPAPIS